MPRLPRLAKPWFVRHLNFRSQVNAENPSTEEGTNLLRLRCGKWYFCLQRCPAVYLLFRRLDWSKINIVLSRSLPGISFGVGCPQSATRFLKESIRAPQT